MSVVIRSNKKKTWYVLGGREIVETIFGLGVVALVSWYLPASWLSSHIIFCSFFLVVFAIAVRYHTRAAYSAGLLAAISYIWLLWQHPEMRIQTDVSHFVLEPFLLLISGVVTSDLLRIQRRRLLMFERKYVRAYEALQKTSRRYQTALAINEELERQVVGQSVSVASISEKMLLLWQRSGDERYAAILDMMVQAVGAQSCALYLLQDEQWCLASECSIGASAYAPLLSADDPLIQHVLLHCRVSTIRDFLAEEHPLPQPAAVMAGPLVDRAKRVVGIVTVDHIPLLKFTPDAIRLFGSLLQIASISLQEPVFSGETVRQAERDRDMTQVDLFSDIIPSSLF